MYWRSRQGWVEVEPTAVTLGDRAFQLGDGVFETFRIESGVIRHSHLHRQSLEEACAAMALAPIDWRDVKTAVSQLHPASGIGKLQLTRGPGGRGLAPLSAQEEALYLQFSPQPEAPVSVRLATSQIRRSASSLAARFKTMSYADNLAARREAVSKSADMALLLTEGGLVSGGDCANLFWVRGGEVFTPSTDCGVRKGVMRRRVMHWLASEQVSVAEIEARPDELTAAQAVFVTNALMGVVPVSEINGQSLPVDHPLLARLLSAGL